MGRAALCQEKSSINISAVGSIELLFGNVCKLLVGPLEGGVVDKDIEPAKFFNRSLDQLLAEGLLANVARHGYGLTTCSFDKPDRLLSILLLVSISV